MADEEIAEEWLDKRYLKDIGVRRPCKQAFLAGLKVGRLEWHKVADGDLPSDRHGHVVINQDCDKVTIRNGRFEYLDGCKAYVTEWCEIPKYTEE